jgi:hypothetical protein
MLTNNSPVELRPPNMKVGYAPLLIAPMLSPTFGNTDVGRIKILKLLYFV